MRAAAAVGDAARSIEHQAIVRRGDEADFRASRSKPIQVRLGVHIQGVAQKAGRNARTRKRRAGEILRAAQTRPVEVGYDAEHERARLPVIASLAAAEESALAVSDPAREIAIEKS